MFNKIEIFGFGASILLMAVALFLIRVESMEDANVTQPAAVGTVTVDGDIMTDPTSVGSALIEASDGEGQLNRLVIDDVVIGTGEPVAKGDTVIVNYIGRLQNGTEFDNSYTRGEPFTFTVGNGRVIAGWEEGVAGMQVGGQRILVIPPTLAYGAEGAGPIPPNATLVFAVELLSIE